MEKIKGLITSEKGKDILVVLIVILVGISSFLLGKIGPRMTQGTTLKRIYERGSKCFIRKRVN